MAVGTITRIAKFVPGATREVIFDLQMGTSYPTGGEPLTAAQIGLDDIYFLEAAAALGTVLEYNHSTGKIKAWRQGAAANAVMNEVANATNLSTITARCRAIGPGSA